MPKKFKLRSAFSFVDDSQEKGSSLGFCKHHYSRGQMREATNSVQIGVAFWRRLDRESRELLIFHELGHCILDRRHVQGSAAGALDESIATGAALQSIMVVNILKFRETYIRNRDFYQNELFGCGNGEVENRPPQ